MVNAALEYVLSGSGPTPPKNLDMVRFIDSVINADDERTKPPVFDIFGDERYVTKKADIAKEAITSEDTYKDAEIAQAIKASLKMKEDDDGIVLADILIGVTLKDRNNI